MNRLSRRVTGRDKGIAVRFRRLKRLALAAAHFVGKELGVQLADSFAVLDEDAAVPAVRRLRRLIYAADVFSAGYAHWFVWFG
jgi:predicted metal-dependent HD superfamily phosphohydrolase